MSNTKNEHPAVTSLRAIHDQPNCRYEVEAQLGEEVWIPLSMNNDYGDMMKLAGDMMKLATEIRDLIFEDGDDTMQDAMIGSPVECLAFAKWWIQRAKGMKPDQDWFKKPGVYGCHCDLFPGMEPDGCVIDSGRIDYCRPAQVLVAEGKTKADCEYWLPVNKAPSI